MGHGVVGKTGVVGVVVAGGGQVLGKDVVIWLNSHKKAMVVLQFLAYQKPESDKNDAQFPLVDGSPEGFLKRT